MKKLSIITINYNNLKGLRKTRGSILSQSFSNYEWIVVDGGSDDGGKDFILEHQKEMAWWCSERDEGIYNAQNKGIARATGEYLLFLNAGDTLLADDTLEQVFACASDADVVYGDWIEQKKCGQKKVCTAPESIDYYLFAMRPICHQAAFIRTSLLKQSPYDETYRICSDWAKWVDLSRQGCKFQHIPIAVCLYVRDGISYHAVRQKEEEHKRILSEFYPKELADVLSTLIEKNNHRLRVVRRLIWLSSCLLFALLVLLFWVFFGT